MPEPNPYRPLLTNYPGRLFPLEDWEKERSAISAVAAGYQQICCELGSGSGGYLLECARQNPQTAYFGFELRYKRAVRTLQKAQNKDIENAFVIRTRAESISEFFGAASLDAIVVNFPDPWAKKRWKKHRMLNVDFLLELAHLLKPGGVLLHKTDHKEYFESFVEMLEALDCFELSELNRDLYQSDYLAGNIQTEFEKLFVHKGMPIYYAKLTKRTGDE